MELSLLAFTLMALAYVYLFIGAYFTTAMSPLRLSRLPPALY